MYSSKFLFLALSLATFTFGTPASSSSSSSSEQSDEEYIIKNLQTRYKDNLQYIRFSVTDPNPRITALDHGDVARETVGHCAAVMNVDNKMLELLPEEFERAWDSLPEEDRPEAGQYQPSTDSQGFVGCTAGFSFLVGDNVAIDREGNVNFTMVLTHEYTSYAVDNDSAIEHMRT